MKAADFYERWNELVTKDWSAAGLTLLAGRGSKWVRQVGDLSLLVRVQVNIKYPWSVESGGDFSVYAYLPREVPPEPVKYVDDVMDELHVFGALDSSLLTELSGLNLRLVEKLRGFDRAWIYERIAKAYDCTPGQARELEMFETGLETLEMELDMPPEALVNPPLCYYDAEDLVRWSEWFRRALPAMLEQIDSAPEYAFKSGKT